MSEEMKACCNCGGGCQIMEERKKLNKEEVLRYSDMEIFKGIEKENLNALLYCMKSYVRSYKKGELIHLEENHEKHVGVVLFGSIHMIKTDVWGRETLLTYMGEGKSSEKHLETVHPRTNMFPFFPRRKRRYFFSPLRKPFMFVKTNAASTSV